LFLQQNIQGSSPVRQVKLLCFFMVTGLSLPGCDNGAETPSETHWPEAIFDASGTYFAPVQLVSENATQLVYVPVYSKVLLSKADSWELAASLSVRNTDPEQSLIVYQIDYFDTSGKLLETFLETPHELQPMATVTLTLPQWDKRGGSGASFLVRWSGDAGINNPIIEVVMAGTRGPQSFSFVRAGQAIDE
jgi:hypothetical protein